MEVNHTFQLPVDPGSVGKSVEVTLFQHLASHAIPAEDNKKEVICSVPVRTADGGSAEVKLRVRREGKAEEQADQRVAEQRDYPAEQMEKCVQELLQDVLREQPCDPYRYMQEQLKARRSKPAAEKAPLVPKPPAGPAPSSASPRKAQAQAQGQGKPAGDIGGVYVDPNHFKPGTFAGTRMVSSPDGQAITLVGSDDGASFWTLFGKFTGADRSDLTIDFSPKGGPQDLKGRYEDGKITFEGGNSWNKAFEPDSAPCTDKEKPGGSEFGGLYTDPNHFKQGSFAGTRMVSDLKGTAPSDDITLVGSDDGLLFWTLSGKFTSKKDGSLEIDFSPKGGPKLAATYVNGHIKYEDGNSWSHTPLPSMMSPKT